MTRARKNKKADKKKAKRGNPFLKERRCIYCNSSLPANSKDRWCSACVKFLDRNPAVTAIEKIHDNPFFLT